MDSWERYVNLDTIQSIGNHVFNNVVIDEPAGIPKANVQNESYAQRRKLEFIRPLHTAAMGDKLPLVNSFISVDKDNVVISAVYYEGDDLIVRLWENSGVASDARLSLPISVTSAVGEDFLGNRDHDVHVSLSDQEISFRIKPCEIITLRCRKQ